MELDQLIEQLTRFRNLHGGKAMVLAHTKEGPAQRVNNIMFFPSMEPYINGPILLISATGEVK